MQVIEVVTLARKWGNSIGIALPKDVVDKAHIKVNDRVHILLQERAIKIGDIFGTLDIKIPTKKLLKEARMGEDVLP